MYHSAPLTLTHSYPGIQNVWDSSDWTVTLAMTMALNHQTYTLDFNPCYPKQEAALL